MDLKNKDLKNIEDKENNMKDMMKNYWKPTPKKWRRLGDALLASATVIAIGGVWQYDSLKDIFTPTALKALIITSIGLGVVGKFLTNFFKEDTSEEK